MEKIRFDDIAALQAQVSEQFGAWSQPMEITQKLINDFADITGDHQWIHIDVERCKKESPFGTTIAHGFLTLSLLPKLSSGSPDGFAVTGYGNATNYGAEGLRFLSPVPAGSKVHARRRLKAVEKTDKGTKVISQVAIHVVGSERPALLIDSIILYQPPRK
jgi:acyl dehydratase